MQVSDYDVILEKGWGTWNNEFMKKIQTPPWHGPFSTARVVWNFIKAGMNTGKNIKHWQQQGMPVMFHTGVAPPFDIFSLSRSLRPFYRDLFDTAREGQAGRRGGHRRHDQAGHHQRQAGQGHAGGHLRHALQRQLPLAQAVRRDLVPLASSGWWRPTTPPGSPRCSTATATGTSCSRASRELPRASCVVELDGATDIRKAKEVLDGQLCIKGDVHAPLFSISEAAEVDDLLPGAHRVHGARRWLHPGLGLRGALHGQAGERGRHDKRRAGIGRRAADMHRARM